MNNFIKNSKFIIQNLITPIFILFLLSCSNTGPQTGNLSGTINLEGQSDHSGIVIGVYELAELDPDIVEANQKWPHIGVIINQHTEFDHRFGTLVKTGETDASGSFEITDIPTGIYNVIVIKDGYGFRYIYEVNVTSGSNSLPNLKSVNMLYPETQVTSDISSTTIWQTNHHYIIEEDIIVDDELTIEQGAVIRLYEGKEITSYGTFNAVGEYENFVWFTKNDGFSETLNSIEPDSTYIWDRVTLEPYSQAQVQWCKFDWANIGLLNHLNGFEISDCIFRESQCGFKSEDVDSTFCSNLLCEEIYNEEQGGIYFLHVDDGCIEKNIVKGCADGIKIYNQSNPEIKNNYLDNCNTVIDISYYSSPNVHNNEIVNSNQAITVTLYSYPQIKNNEIKTVKGIMTYHCSYYNLVINYNNLNCIIFALETKTYNYIPTDIDATNNYFFTKNETEIQELIYDKNDVEPSQQQYYGIVDYFPFLTQKYPYAGIQGE